MPFRNLYINDIAAADVAGGAVYLTDILRQIPAVGIPGAVFLDSQRAGGDVLRGVPGNVPQRGVVAAGEVDAGNLQVAAVDVALMQRDTAVGGYLLRCAAAHVVVLAMHGGDGAVCCLAGEVRGAVFGIVGDSPDADTCLHMRLVAVCMANRRSHVTCRFHHRIYFGCKPEFLTMSTRYYR